MIRIKISSWTATFRFPTFQSGFQPTLPLPPLSTILGLLSATKGEIVSLKDLDFVGYIFKSEAKGEDLERTYALGKPKTDVIKREFLVNNTLYLYLTDEWSRYFKNPRYQLLLGRSCDLATVDEIKKVDLEQKNESFVGGTIVPIHANISGVIQALPVEFNYSTMPRVPKIVKPFILIPFPRTPRDRNRCKYYGSLPYDEEVRLGVWLYGRDLLS